jgi:histidine decarboxylase
MVETRTRRNFCKRLNQLHRQFKLAAKQMAGYPENQIFNYSKFSRFLKFSINNVGDPFEQGSAYRLNTHDFEKEVIDEFAHIFHAPIHDYWGYVTNGGSESNLFGLYVARDIYPEGIVYCSDQTHYSVHKNIHLLRMRGVRIESLPNGEIDYRKLKDTIAAHRTIPPIIVANIGTTMKGAVDNISHIQQILNELKIENYYIHCDAALFGMLLPFLPPIKSQNFDFSAGVDSIAISGHKMIGMPIPCGVVLTKQSHKEKIVRDIEYTGSQDSTILGSRNGFTPLLLWYEMIWREKRHVMEKLADDCITKAEYAVEQFNKHGIHAWKNDNSIIVVFPRPLEPTRYKWQLAVEGDIAHIITLPQVSYKIIDKVIEEVASDLRLKS